MYKRQELTIFDLIPVEDDNDVNMFADGIKISLSISGKGDRLALQQCTDNAV